MLLKREDLRNRLLRLAGISQLNLMTQALDDATADAFGADQSAAPVLDAGADGASPNASDAGLQAGDATVVAAPATATPARNLRRLTSGREFFRAISSLPLHGHAGWP